MVILLIFTTLFTQNIFVDNSNRPIGNYLDLLIELDNDTISFNDELTITVVFKNKTDSTLSFYPKATLSIVRPGGGFEFDSYFLNKVIDVTQPQEITPNDSYTETYLIKAEHPVFREGNNRLHLYYICNKLKGRLKKYNTLYGSLESAEFKIYVK